MDVGLDYQLTEEAKKEVMERMDKDGCVMVENTLQCFYLSLCNPPFKLKSKHPDVQDRIDAYNRTKNLAVFMSPTEREIDNEGIRN